MSYNIDSIDIRIIKPIWMNHDDAVWLADEDRVEIGPLDDLENLGESGRVKLKHLNWCGEGSGHSFDYFKREVLTKIHGHAELRIVWEGGDSITGLIVKDGKVIECSVEWRLVPK
jgi:hypothetical protein